MFTIGKSHSQGRTVQIDPVLTPPHFFLMISPLVKRKMNINRNLMSNEIKHLIRSIVKSTEGLKN